MNIPKLYSLFKSTPIVSTDSRTIKKGALFFALKGDNFDGNKYAQNALDNGASFCIVDNKAFKINEQCILVKDALETLQQLATYHLQQINIKTIAITGSNGKTTTKEICTAVLAQKYKVKATEGNLNNHIGVPLTVLSFTNNLDFGIIEMGANHIGEIKFLSDMVNPKYGIITNIGTAHIEGFGSYEGVFKAKTELFENLSKNNGLAFIHSRNNSLVVKSAEFELESVLFGDDKKAVIDGKIVSNNPFINVTIYGPDKKGSTTIKSNLIGSYNLENILAGACIGKYFGVDTDQIKHAIENYVPDNMRSQFIETPSNKIILDAYNANPSSMKLAVTNLAALDHPNKIAILGDMMELGDLTHDEHQIIVDLLKENNITTAFLVGTYFGNTRCNYSKFENTEKLIEHLNRENLQQSMILIKGSRKTRMERIVEYL